MCQCLLGHKESRKLRAQNEAKINEELLGRFSRRARRDNDDEPGSENSDPELTKIVERKHATRARGKTLVDSWSRGSTCTDPQRASPIDSYVLRKQSSTQPKIKQALRGVGVPAHAAESEHFQPMFDVVADARPGFKAPSR
ncbi:hypothetical protein Taro_034423 [Colocasia esculenta]|uniref:Uncharacterized protein n=1 Tax=Colocasia esculenta TaxID=4460 RepID=A0A843WA02_COLES|nr:hypothetical protein [Colocasia esculenta]